MANYSLTINSKFRPFSYAEMLAPVQAMTQAHQAVEEQYAELMTKASVWENMANEQRDPRAYSMYKNYADQLYQAADELNRNGLTAQSRPQMLALKAGYSKYITPIENAYKLRLADIEQQRKDAQGKGANIIFSERAANRSLDEYLNGQPLDYTSTDLSDVMSKAATGATAISSRYYETEEGKKFLDGYLTLVKRTGINPRDEKGNNRIVEILRGTGEYPELEKFINDMKNTFSTPDYAPEDRAKIEKAVDMGINMGIVYKEEYETKENWKEHEQIQHNNSMALARYKANLDRENMLFQKALEGQQENDESLGEYDVLEDNGVKSAYLSTRNALALSNGALRSAYFGRTGKANPMQVYNEIQKYAKEHPVIASNSSTSRSRNAFEPLSAIAINRREENRQASLANATNVIKRKYGVTAVISAQQYKHLKELGYTTNSTFEDFRYKLDKRISSKATQYTHSSVNLPKEGLDVANERLIGNLYYREKQAKNTENLVWEFGKNGKAGKPKKPSDYIDFSNIDKNALTDIYYSMQEPNKVHVMINNKRLFVSPDAFGERRVTEAVNRAANLLALSDSGVIDYYRRQGYEPKDAYEAREWVQKECTLQIKNIVRGYSKGRSKTDSKI